MKNELHNVSVQRNELRRCLAELCDKLQHGAYNHMFMETNPRSSGEDKETCEKGHKRYDVIWSLGRCCCDCDGCGKECQLSFEEKRLFDAAREAMAIIERPDAEMPPVEAEDFPVYDPNREYKATDRWIARSFYRFSVGYWLFSDHRDKENESKWERAFDNLLAIGLDTIGKDGKAFQVMRQKMNELMASCTDANEMRQKAKELRDGHPEAIKLLEEAVDFIYDKKRGKEEKLSAKNIVFLALTLRMDYNFGHKYPGADMGVYGDVFCGLIDVALKMVGLDREDEPWQGDGESKSEYAKRLAEAKATHKEEIYAFMTETEGLSS